MEILKPLLLIFMLLAFYPLPVALLGSAALRLALGWSRAPFLTALSGLLALPNAWLVLMGGRGLFAAAQNQLLVAGAAALCLAGLGAWLMALRRTGPLHIWLEPLVLAGATAYLLLTISNWIAH